MDDLGYHPDPAKLRELAKGWRAQAKRLETYVTLMKDQFNGIEWNSDGKFGAAHAVFKISMGARKVVNAVNDWAQQLEDSADDLEKKLHKLKILEIVSTVFMVVGIVVSLAIAPLVGPLASLLADLALTIGLEIGLETSFFISGFVLYGALTTVLDFTMLGITDAITGEHVKPGFMDAINIGLGAFMGGLSSHPSLMAPRMPGLGSHIDPPALDHIAPGITENPPTVQLGDGIGTGPVEFSAGPKGSPPPRFDTTLDNPTLLDSAIPDGGAGLPPPLTPNRLGQTPLATGPTRTGGITPPGTIRPATAVPTTRPPAVVPAPEVPGGAGLFRTSVGTPPPAIGNARPVPPLSAPARSLPPSGVPRNVPPNLDGGPRSLSPAPSTRLSTAPAPPPSPRPPATPRPPVAEPPAALTRPPGGHPPGGHPPGGHPDGPPSRLARTDSISSLGSDAPTDMSLSSFRPSSLGGGSSRVSLPADPAGPPAGRSVPPSDPTSLPSPHPPTTVVRPPDTTAHPPDTVVRPPDASVHPSTTSVRPPDATIHPPTTSVRPPAGTARPPDSIPQADLGGSARVQQPELSHQPVTGGDAPSSAVASGGSRPDGAAGVRQWATDVTAASPNPPAGPPGFAHPPAAPPRSTAASDLNHLGSQGQRPPIESRESVGDPLSVTGPAPPAEPLSTGGPRSSPPAVASPHGTPSPPGLARPDPTGHRSPQSRNPVHSGPDDLSRSSAPSAASPTGDRGAAGGRNAGVPAVPEPGRATAAVPDRQLIRHDPQSGTTDLVTVSGQPGPGRRLDGQPVPTQPHQAEAGGEPPNYYTADPHTGQLTDIHLASGDRVTHTARASGQLPGAYGWRSGQRIPVGDPAHRVLSFRPADNHWEVQTVPSADQSTKHGVYTVIPPAAQRDFASPSIRPIYQVLRKDGSGNVDLVTYPRKPLIDPAEAQRDGAEYYPLYDEPGGWRHTDPLGTPDRVERVSSAPGVRLGDGARPSAPPAALIRDGENGPWVPVRNVGADETAAEPTPAPSYFRAAADGHALEPIQVHGQPMDVMRVDPQTGMVHTQTVRPMSDSRPQLAMNDDGSLVNRHQVTTSPGDMRFDPQTGRLIHREQVSLPETASGDNGGGGFGPARGPGRTLGSSSGGSRTHTTTPTRTLIFQLGDPADRPAAHPLVGERAGTLTPPEEAAPRPQDAPSPTDDPSVTVSDHGTPTSAGPDAPVDPGLSHPSAGSGTSVATSPDGIGGSDSLVTLFPVLHVSRPRPPEVGLIGAGKGEPVIDRPPWMLDDPDYGIFKATGPEPVDLLASLKPKASGAPVEGGGDPIAAEIERIYAERRAAADAASGGPARPQVPPVREPGQGLPTPSDGITVRDKALGSIAKIEHMLDGPPVPRVNPEPGGTGVPRPIPYILKNPDAPAQAQAQASVQAPAAPSAQAPLAPPIHTPAAPPVHVPVQAPAHAPAAPPVQAPAGPALGDLTGSTPKQRKQAILDMAGSLTEPADFQAFSNPPAQGASQTTAPIPSERAYAGMMGAIAAALDGDQATATSLAQHARRHLSGSGRLSWIDALNGLAQRRPDRSDSLASIAATIVDC